MKRCAYCGREREDTVTLCPECGNDAVKESLGSPLETTAEDSEPPRKNKLITLKTCRDIVEADMIRAQLEAEGISAYVPDQFISQTFALNPNAFGFVVLQVAEKDAEAAKQILGTFQKPPASENQTAVDHSQEPLSRQMRIVAACLPLIAPTIAGLFVFAFIKGAYTTKGYDRKSTEMWKWFIRGAIFWFIALVIILGATSSRTR
jgi:hypothetical protein